MKSYSIQCGTIINIRTQFIFCTFNIVKYTKYYTQFTNQTISVIFHTKYTGSSDFAFKNIGAIKSKNLKTTVKYYCNRLFSMKYY